MKRIAIAAVVALVGLTAGAALVNHLEFNDAGNDGLNLLNATVGANAIVRSGKGAGIADVAGIGDLTAVSGEGRSDGVGAVSIPKGQFLAIAHAIGTDTMKPWCMVMRVRDPNASFTSGFRAFYSLVQDNSADGSLFRNSSNTAIGRGNWWCRYGDSENMYCGDFTPSEWHTVVISFFGANIAPGSYCYLDDLTEPLLKRGGTAYSADSLVGKPYIYISADDGGEDNVLEFDDIKIYNAAEPDEVFGIKDHIRTAPWQQNVYTNRFTIMCEMDAVVDGLRLEYGEGYAQNVAMTYTESNGGSCIYKGVVQIDGQAGATIPYRLGLSSATIPEDYAGTVKLWSGDPDESFSCAIWGDNQEGLRAGDWDADKFLYLTRAFQHMLSRNVDFGLTSGDLASNAGYSSEITPCLLRSTNAILGKEKPYYLVWGNHDEANANRDKTKPFFDIPGDDTGYYVYRGNVLFIFVHWDAYSSNLDATKSWLAGILATPEAQSAKFRILVQHAPMFLEVWGNNKKDGLLQTAVDGGIDVVFSGHMHGYERIHRNGIVQLTNGGLGYLDHGESVVNNYGSDTKVGGHLDTPYLWARQSSNGVLGEPSPVHMGCITSYGEMKVSGNKLTYLAHGFNADGSYIGVFDTFELTSKTVAGVPASAPAPTPCADPGAYGAVTNAPCTKALWAQYKTAIGETYEYEGSGTDPVTSVSKDEIDAFCAWLNGDRVSGLYRLPEAAEISADSVSLWTGEAESETGWIKTVGTATVYGTDRSAISTSGCFANYLGFRLTVDPPLQDNSWITEPTLSRLTLYGSTGATFSPGEAVDGNDIAEIKLDGRTFSGTELNPASLKKGSHTITVTIPYHPGWMPLTKSITFTVEPNTLVNYFTFDDTNDLLKASVGADGQIFHGRKSANPVDGLGACTAVNGEGHTDNAGALCIPLIGNDSQFLAISHGIDKDGIHPWCMVLRCYAPPSDGNFYTFYTLSQSNNEDGNLFVKKTLDSRIGSGKWENLPDSGNKGYAPGVYFTGEIWHTLVLSCDGETTRIWLDNADQCLPTEGFFNWRDASYESLSGKNYIYISGDNDGDDGTMYFDYIKIYSEAFPASVFAQPPSEASGFVIIVR